MNKNFIRIIPKLDIKNNNLIKGVNLEGLRALGDPYDFAQVYSQHGADEIFYIDNVATLYGTNNLTKFVSQTAMNLRIPLSVGGGIRSIDDISKMLHAGADKVSINSVLVDDINFLKKAIKIFGSSTITVIVECIKIKNRYFISKSNGRDLVNENPLDWCKKLEDFGAGELFITSVNHEGLKNGFDIPLIKKISKKSFIPIIAHGGAGNFEHIWDVIRQTNISGVSIAGFFHYNYLNNFKIKKNNMIGNFNFVDTAANKKKTNLIMNLKKFLKKEKLMSDKCKKIKIKIIDLGLNNIFSLYHALNDIGFKVSILDVNNNKIDTDILVIPGVGAFPKAINFLKKNNLDKKIKEFNDKNRVIFGICLGMQLLFDSSSEFGNHKGLSLISGTVKKIDKKLIKVPNIGWFPITHTNKKNIFLSKKFNNEFFYFVHSYYCNPLNQENIITTTKISKFNFCSSVQKKKLLGVQFHPEKSGDKGMQILRNLYKLV